MFIADTDFIINLVNSDPGAVQKAREIDENKAQVGISSITVQEYLRGIYYLFNTDLELLNKKLFKAESDLAHFHCFVYDYTLAKEASKIDALLTQKGIQIGFADVIIGATALFHKYKLLTRNVKHFSKITGLEIENY